MGIHLGARLGEFVNRSIDDVGYLKEIDVWYQDIPIGKNNNSIRRLPITEGLMRLGLIDYVKHVRSLGGKFLFPHRNWSTPTVIKDPSKNTSARFETYLNSIGLPASDLVFHSFRHSVVSAMQDNGVPLSHAMQIVGHEAQEFAVKTGRITAAQSRSVHLKVYTHVDLARLGVEYPILALKEALEKSIRPPIDYQALACAAAIVREHLKKVGGKFVADWPPQREKYTAQMIDRLNIAVKAPSFPAVAADLAV